MTNQERKSYYHTLSSALVPLTSSEHCLPPNLPSREALSQRGYGDLYTLLDHVESVYEFDLQKIVPLNHIQFAFWQQQFCGSECTSGELAATEFVLFCCLADKILDSGRFSPYQKEQVCKKLKSSHFFSASPVYSEGFPELDALMNHVRQHLVGLKLSSHERAELSSHMQLAFDSEIYMYQHKLHDPDLVPESEVPLLINKSVEFELTAFLITSAPHITPQMVQIATCIGRLLWLVDDLWDLPEDIDALRQNSLLFLHLPFLPKSIDERFQYVKDHMIDYRDMIISDLRLLENTVNSSLLNCIQWQVLFWSRHICDAR